MLSTSASTARFLSISSSSSRSCASMSPRSRPLSISSSESGSAARARASASRALRYAIFLRCSFSVSVSWWKLNSSSYRDVRGVLPGSEWMGWGGG